MVKVDFAGLDCLMISKEALKKIKFRYEINKKTKDIVSDSVCFSQDAKKNGFEIHANLGIRCQHLFYGGWCVALGDTKGKFLKQA